MDFLGMTTRKQVVSLVGLVLMGMSAVQGAESTVRNYTGFRIIVNGICLEPSEFADIKPVSVEGHGDKCYQVLLAEGIDRAKPVLTYNLFIIETGIINVTRNEEGTLLCNGIAAIPVHTSYNLKPYQSWLSGETNDKPIQLDGIAKSLGKIGNQQSTRNGVYSATDYRDPLAALKEKKAAAAARKKPCHLHDAPTESELTRLLSRQRARVDASDGTGSGSGSEGSKTPEPATGGSSSGDDASDGDGTGAPEGSVPAQPTVEAAAAQTAAQKGWGPWILERATFGFWTGSKPTAKEKDTTAEEKDAKE
jgi:hypothetical protein